MSEQPQPPAEHEIRTAIEANAAELAKAEDKSVPGTTRVSLLVGKESDGITARVRTDNRNATPIPPVSDNKVYLSRVAVAHDFQEDAHREWWHSGAGVEEEGLDFFDNVEWGGGSDD